MLGEWEIPVSKVTAILTDNGSNMLKVFSTQIVQNEARNDEEFVSKEIEHDVDSLSG